ncbi:MAG: GNAT family N-acetyltransferase [Nanohaloarchaea archaeon]|nr:GNAT family N-acetyltransferase [Candidatus Nanohaloarchaea archaeon]
MRIRTADIEDREILAHEMWIELAEMMEPYSEANELKEDPKELALNGFENVLESEDYETFLIEKDGNEIGFMNVKVEEKTTFKMDKCLDIVDLFIKEGFRGEGYGTKLVEKAEEYADKTGCDYITVSAEWKNKKAQEFYEKKGFKQKQVQFIKLRDEKWSRR